jgi:hypothetical protein
MMKHISTPRILLLHVYSQRSQKASRKLSVFGALPVVTTDIGKVTIEQYGLC